MRYLLTSFLCVFTLSLTAQETCPNVFDFDNDGNIAINDFIAMLSYFGDTDSDSDGVFDSEDDCIDETACNYQSNPTESCDDIDVLGLCGGTCAADIDGDGICDLIPITNDNIHAAVGLWISDAASAEATYGHISDWDVSNVTDMANMFHLAYSFNDDISSWDVSSVTNMTYMFSSASNFNGDLSSWDVSSVTDMSAMFFGGASFNGDISSWDVSSVTDMSWMFAWGPSSFNADLSSWDVSSVTSMYSMFAAASSFNSNVSSWDVSSVTNFELMFYSMNVSDENKCLIHTSFSSNTNWPYGWAMYCD